MKQFCIFIIVIFFASSLSAQDQWELDMMEEESLILFNTGQQLRFIADHILEYDHQLSNLDTSQQNGKIEYRILSEQRTKVLTNALWNFQQVTHYYPKSSVCNQALFNKAELHLELNQIDSARIDFVTLTQSSIPSVRDSNEVSHFWDEHYHNFKNLAYTSLAEIEIRDSNYQLALQYLDKAKEVGYKHFCGNEHQLNAEHSAMIYAQCYYRLDSLDKSIEILLPHALRNPLTFNYEIIELTLKYLREQYNDEFLINELEKSFRHYEKKIKPNSRRERFFIQFLGQELPLLIPEINHNEEEKVIQEILVNEPIYRILKGLPLFPTPTK